MIRARSAPASSPAAIADLLASVRRRWMVVRAMRAVARAAAAALAALAALLAADHLFAPPDLVMIALAACAAGGAAGFAAWILRPLRRGPADRQVARFVEERCPELQDRLASAIDSRDRPSPFGGRVLDDASRRARGVDVDRVVAARTVRRAVAAGAGATAALVVLLLAGADVVGRVARSAWLYASPFGATLIVEPGAARLAADESLEVRARLAGTLGAFGRSVPRVTVVDGAGGRTTLEMRPRGAGYAAALPPAARSFTYRVAAAAIESDDYAVRVLRAPRVERIDVAYDHPAHTGLEPRVETGGGDVFAPEGATVTVTVRADKPLRAGSLRLASGGEVTLRRAGPAALSASFEVTRDDAYRVALRDTDGLSNRAGAEYVVRALADDAPLVEIRRPGGDREITPLEEVVIEARAEDDFALARFDLVYAVAGGAERVVDLLGAEPVARGAGVHTLRAEDLGVSPGDVISYYVRAGDANPARVRETRSDVHFLEVRPFEREFEDAPSQSSLSLDAGTVGQLAAAQKEIVAATWSLDGRPDLAPDDGDLVAVADAQAGLRQTALGAAARLLQRGSARAGRQALAAAVSAMARAEEALRAGSTATALPPEMEALAALLRARAAVRRTRVSRGGSGRSAAWRPREDLSALFDRDLRREQQTSYEHRPSPPPAESSAESDALRRVRELAERQAALDRARDDPARRRHPLGADEEARVLARLTREQEELRRRAEALERLRDLARTLLAGGEAAASADRRRLAAEPRAAGDVRGIPEAPAARLGQSGAEPEDGFAASAGDDGQEAGAGRAGTEPEPAAATRFGAAGAGRRSSLPIAGGGPAAGTRSDDAESRSGARVDAGGEPAGRGAAARELLRRLEGLPDLEDALRAAWPGALEDLAGWAARPGGGGPARQAFAPDLAAWESLRDGLRQALEAFDADRSRALPAAEARGRLDVGAREAAPEDYRALVERYYRALADHPPRRPREPR